MNTSYPGDSSVFVGLYPSIEKHSKTNDLSSNFIKSIVKSFKLEERSTIQELLETSWNNSEQNLGAKLLGAIKSINPHQDIQFEVNVSDDHKETMSDLCTRLTTHINVNNLNYYNKEQHGNVQRISITYHDDVVTMKEIDEHEYQEQLKASYQKKVE